MSRHHMEKLYIFFAVITLLLSGINKSNAQDNLQFQHFTSEDGLSENFVYCVYQDKKGYLWIGTHDGLNRYDGYGFKKFRHIPADTNSLPDNTIYSICEDGNGNIWMGTNAGLCKYDPFTGLFSTITLQKKLTTIQQVIAVNEEELMLWHDRKLCLINICTKQEINLNYKDSNGLNPVRISRSPISQDREGNIYLANLEYGDSIILKYDREHKFFNKLITLTGFKKNETYELGYFSMDSRNHCWFQFGEFEMYIFDISSLILKKEQFRQKARIIRTNTVRHIFVDNEGDTWIAGNAGLIWLDRKSGKAYRYKHDDKNTTSISSDDIQYIFQDRAGILWIATSNGLNKLNPFQKKIGNLAKSRNSKDGLYNNFVLGVFPEGNDQIRIHYNIYEKPYFTRYHIRNQSFRHIAYNGYDAARLTREVLVQNPERLTNELSRAVMAFYQKLDGRSFVKNPLPKIWIDERQQLWTDQHQILSVINPDAIWLRDTIIEQMQPYGNYLWVASPKGLIQFNTLTKTSVVYNADASGGNRISSNDITCFVFEQKGNMWIGTKGGGLNFFDRQKNKFFHLTEKDGLSNNSIYCMVKDDKGNLWLGTGFGLSNFDPVTRKFKNYFKTDGLINNEYNRFSACKMPNGTIFMGGMDGIDYFHPDSLRSNKNKPQVEITDLKIFNESILQHESLSLEHNQNYITIEFAAMDFGNPGGNKFSYKLEGLDKDWVPADNRNFATYSILPPGSYRFQVKAANSDGVWNDEPAVCQFTILPAWYQTWWFFSWLMLTAAAIIYAFFRYRLQQKLRVLQVRNRLHRDLHDDIGATLSSVKAYSEILKDNPDNPVIAELIKDNSTEMLERLEVIAWATNPQHDHFKSLKSRMIKFANPLCHTKNIQFELESNTIQEEMLMPGELRQNIFLVFKEAIHNMVKYSEATACRVQLFIRSNQFILQVTDNGKGFDGIIKGTGNGWKNMLKRTEGLNGKLLIDSSADNGTKITMQLSYPFKIPSSWDAKQL